MKVRVFTKGSKVRTLVYDDCSVVLYVTEYGYILRYSVSISSSEQQVDDLYRQMARDGYNLNDVDDDN